MTLTYFVCEERVALLTTKYCRNCTLTCKQVNNLNDIVTYSQDQVTNGEHEASLKEANRAVAPPIFSDDHRIY